MRTQRCSAKKSSAPARSTDGFSLIEVLASLLLLSGVLAGVWGLFSSVARISSYSEGLTMATALAQEKAEELISVPIASAASGSDSVGIYSRSWTVSAGATAGILDIDVDVAWERLTTTTNHVRVVTMRN